MMWTQPRLIDDGLVKLPYNVVRDLESVTGSHQEKYYHKICEERNGIVNINGRATRATVFIRCCGSLPFFMTSVDQ